MTSPHLARLGRVQQAASQAQLDALLITPGADLRYLTGYPARSTERLTCLLVPAGRDPVLVVPALERTAAEASPVGLLGIDIVGWEETDDPSALVLAQLPGRPLRLGLDNHMWAEQVLRIRDAAPDAKLTVASDVLCPLRMRKDDAEVAALREAGAAIDRVHARMGEWLRAGRTEREVARDIADAILVEGHQRVDFVIVASGPNGASPHHEAGDRVIQVGDPVVIDIGGTTPAGYCSDSTRTYAVGGPPEEFLSYYAVLHVAQLAACSTVQPGVPCERIDAVAREVIAAAGYGEFFVHRTGHGIGLETHEHPYIVTGNATPLEPGMAFSVEPGIYFPGRHGARIEDILVCTDTGAEPLNNRPRELVILDTA